MNAVNWHKTIKILFLPAFVIWFILLLFYFQEYISLPKNDHTDWPESKVYLINMNAENKILDWQGIIPGDFLPDVFKYSNICIFNKNKIYYKGVPIMNLAGPSDLISQNGAMNFKLNTSSGKKVSMYARISESKCITILSSELVNAVGQIEFGHIYFDTERYEITSTDSKLYVAPSTMGSIALFIIILIFWSGIVLFGVDIWNFIRK